MDTLLEEDLERWSSVAKREIKNGKWDIDNPKFLNLMGFL